MSFGVYLFVFFFSSRRRHTRCLSDWSSDVCSSDLAAGRLVPEIDCIIIDSPQPSAYDGAKSGGLVTMTCTGRGGRHRGGQSNTEIGRASCRERVKEAVRSGSIDKKKRDESEVAERG